MSDRFAAELVFEKGFLSDGGAIIGLIEGTVVSTIPQLKYKMIGIEEDIFSPLVFEDERLQILDQGIYHVFIDGIVWFESDIDWESGIAEGSYVFEAKEKNVRFLRIGDSNDNT